MAGMTKILPMSLKYHESGINKYTILREPYLLHPEDYICAEALDLDYVFCHHKRFTEKYWNWHWYPHGGTFIDNKDWNIYEKPKILSMFVSEKDTMPGHLLRRDVAREMKGRFDGYGIYFGKRIDHKINGLRDYAFQIVIESCQERGYFTEKILDCFLTGTVPIYWGDPEIGQIFDPQGMVQWNGSMIDLSITLSKIEQNFDEAMAITAEAVVENFRIAQKYVNYNGWLREHYPEVFA